MRNFVKGVLFTAVALPLIDGLNTLNAQVVKYLCTKIALETYKLEQQFPQEQQNVECYEQTNAIGFITDSNVCCEQDDDYEEEDE